VDGRGAAISTSKTDGIRCDANESMYQVDDCKSAAPVEKTGELGKGKAHGAGSAPRPYLSLNVEVKLFSEE